MGVHCNTLPGDSWELVSDKLKAAKQRPMFLKRGRGFRSKPTETAFQVINIKRQKKRGFSILTCILWDRLQNHSHNYASIVIIYKVIKKRKIYNFEYIAEEYFP